MKEQDIQKALVEILGKSPTCLAKIPIINTNDPNISSLADLFKHHSFDIFEDTNLWNKNPNCMDEIIGGMTPDIVIRSKYSGENRIIIEVKAQAKLAYKITSSQIIRYFLHLLATSKSNPIKGKQDITRAILLAAPNKWFDTYSTAKAWDYFFNQYKDLAMDFNIVLGEIRFPLPPSLFPLQSLPD